MNELTSETEGKSFEQLKQRNEHGAIWCSSRESPIGDIPDEFEFMVPVLGGSEIGSPTA